MRTNKLFWSLKIKITRRHNFGNPQQKPLLDNRGMRLARFTFPGISTAALDWFKHNLRKVPTWQVTARWYFEFIFDQLRAASASSVWPHTVHQRENPLYKGHLSLEHWGQMRWSWTSWSSWLFQCFVVDLDVSFMTFSIFPCKDNPPPAVGPCWLSLSVSSWILMETNRLQLDHYIVWWHTYLTICQSIRWQNQRLAESCCCLDLCAGICLSIICFVCWPQKIVLFSTEASSFWAWRLLLQLVFEMIKNTPNAVEKEQINLSSSSFIFTLKNLLQCHRASLPKRPDI